jgi:hypothetical protein
MKIISPLDDDRITLCRFTGELSFSRVVPTSKFSVRGKMVASGDLAAQYDLQLGRTDGTNHFPIAEMIDLVTPLRFPKTTMFETLFGSAARGLFASGIDAVQHIISPHLQIKDAGLILKQQWPGFSSVSILDVYGTFDVKEQVSSMIGSLTTALGLPGNLHVPKDVIPDITVAMHGLCSATAGSASLSLAFSWPLFQFGTIAVQIAPLNSSSAKIDLSVVCNSDVTFLDIFDTITFSAFSLSKDKSDFQAGEW